MLPTVPTDSEKIENAQDETGKESISKNNSVEEIKSTGSNHLPEEPVGNGVNAAETDESANTNTDKSSEMKDTVSSNQEEIKPDTNNKDDNKIGSQSDQDKTDDDKETDDKGVEMTAKLPEKSTDEKQEEEPSKTSNEEKSTKDEASSLTSNESPKRSPKRKSFKETPKRQQQPEMQEQTRSGRVRKQISRLSTEMDQVFKEKEKESATKQILIAVGRGTALGDIDSVSKSLQKPITEKLKILHRLLFGRSGKSHNLRSNIRKFNGFDFTEDSDAYSKKLSWLTSQKVSDIKSCLKVLCLEISGSREELSKRLMKFLLEPNPDATKHSHSKSKGRKPKKTVKTKNKSGDGDTNNDDDDDDDDDDDEKSSSDNESSTPHKKTVVKRKSSGIKESSAAKKPKKSANIDDMDDIFASVIQGDSSDNSDKPAVKSSSDVKKHPTDSDLKQTVKDCLKDADLESITMKTVCQQVFDKYPDFDLSHKRELIKKTVKQVLSST